MLINHFNTLAEVYCTPVKSPSRYPNAKYVFEMVKILPSKVRGYRVNLMVAYTFVNESDGLRYRFIFREYGGGGPFSFLLHKDSRVCGNWVYEGLVDLEGCREWCDRIEKMMADPNIKMVHKGGDQ